MAVECVKNGNGGARRSQMGEKEKSCEEMKAWVTLNTVEVHVLE